MIHREKDWNEYWNKQNEKNSSLYGFIAQFYRKLLIKRSLNYFIIKNFKKNSKLLHAGCGSGQVDKDISKIMNLTALDFSYSALKIYLKENKNKLVLGDIFSLPLKNNSYDGVYNLGVLEHFQEKEIHDLLKEINRVLKKNGKVVIFWPPVFGLSVIVLRVLQFFLKQILKREIKLHPDEVSLLKSRTHAEKIFKKAGFNMDKFYFGFKDFFTQAVIVGTKMNK